jgi:hypothetical protein
MHTIKAKNGKHTPLLRKFLKRDYNFNDFEIDNLIDKDTTEGYTPSMSFECFTKDELMNCILNTGDDLEGINIGYLKRMSGLKDEMDQNFVFWDKRFMKAYNDLHEEMKFKLLKNYDGQVENVSYWMEDLTVHEKAKREYERRIKKEDIGTRLDYLLSIS